MKIIILETLKSIAHFLRAAYISHFFPLTAFKCKSPIISFGNSNEVSFGDKKEMGYSAFLITGFILKKHAHCLNPYMDIIKVSHALHSSINDSSFLVMSYFNMFQYHSLFLTEVPKYGTRLQMESMSMKEV